MALTETQKRRIEEEEREKRHLKATTELIQANQKYGLPAFLSFLLPGLGQTVKGEAGKGIFIMIIQFVFFLLCFVAIGVIPLIILWIWNIFDSYNHVPAKS